MIGSKRVINLLLLFLIFLDLVLSIVAIFFPELWFSIFHGQPYVDPQGLLRRTGAVWVAFTLLQFIAYLRWEKQPYWLVLVAGVRLTELFSDWVYLCVAGNVTWYGGVGLFIAPIGNLIMGWFLIRSYLKITSSKKADTF